MFLRPHPEERAFARVSKDGPRVHVLQPSFETFASQAPQDEASTSSQARKRAEPLESVLAQYQSLDRQPQGLN
ncbi:MAG TPA: hypothetical protein VGO18_35955, partial [Steroidobacteraceae bacterium]|nr:hypothetical protein [Steroidobacteraceae bacterium]